MNPFPRAGRWLADTGPVAVLAGIAGAGSFTHIRATATQHGQHGPMAWAVAVCIDLTCVMAARERQREKRAGRAGRRVSWPSLVLGGGVTLSLGANLDQAQPSIWGWLVAATPCGAFLIAVSMLERRAVRASRTPALAAASSLTAAPAVSPETPPSFAETLPVPTASATDVESSPVPSLAVRQPSPPSSSPEPSSSESSASGSGSGPAPALLDFARRVAVEHTERHGKPITRDALRARLGISNALASDLLHHLRNQPA